MHQLLVRCDVEALAKTLNHAENLRVEKNADKGEEVYEACA